MTIRLGVGEALQAHTKDLVTKLCDAQFASRLYQKDPSLWGTPAQSEAATRLGWVDSYEHLESTIHDATLLRNSLEEEGIVRVVLCGMGGSSLGPEVLARSAQTRLHVLDTSHPAEVRRALEEDLAHTVVIVSSKSGTTQETVSQALSFQAAFERVGLDPTRHIVFVTDPDSSLATRQAAGYRVFLADPSIGGRFSVLSAFGIVPAILVGVDVRAVVDEALVAQKQLFSDSPDNPAMILAATIASDLPTRFVLLISEATGMEWGLGDWIEQLVAESTGKSGKGVLPIALPAGAPELTQPPSNALLVRLGSEAADTETVGAASVCVLGSLGAQFLLWEVATVMLGALIGVNPFDQPDVETSKAATRQILNEGAATQAAIPPFSPHTLDEVAAIVPDNGYLAIQAFIDREDPSADRVRELRNTLAARLGLPVALGWGPRYLHSTGQLHKGGPTLGAYLQIIDTDTVDLEIPGSTAGFGAMMHAQARGDRDVLVSRGRPVITCALPEWN